tara:strand:+ start:42 stop:737 length:696 start_codon:yes stop_codon:yes gene_type:complete
MSNSYSSTCTLFYGSGNCSIEGTNIRGVEIRFRGAISITDKTNSNFSLTSNNNRIIIFPVGNGFLNDLFDYVGEFKIVSVIVADNDAESVHCRVKKVMDYSELLNSKSEDLTVKSESLSAGYIYGDSTNSQTILDQPIIPNLNTSKLNINLYYKNGKEYHGLFHIHLKNSAAMTGGTHNESSQDLYYLYIIDKKYILFPTKNDPSVPPSKLNSNKYRKKHGININLMKGDG